MTEGDRSLFIKQQCGQDEACIREVERRLKALEAKRKRGESHQNASAGETRGQTAGTKRIIGGYEILKEIGRGGMGVVYLARHSRLNRLVALKMILPGGHVDSTDLARFRTEAEAIARLQHPNIIQIHEIGEHEGRPFFSLEFVDNGLTLLKRLNGTPHEDWGKAASLVETLARAIHVVHQANILHRDLKPENILLTPNGTPKVTDFGLAKRLDVEGHTGTGQTMGTPSYMAPEQARGTANIGPAADVYALGGILYACLTGRPPFRAATVPETVWQVLNEEPVSPRRLQSKTPRDLETICLKCLRKDPRGRYLTAQALAEDLRRFLENRPIDARPVSPWERFKKWVRRKPAVAALAFVLAFVLTLGLVVAACGWAYHEAEVHRTEVNDRVEKLRICDINLVPKIVGELEPDRAWINPSLKGMCSGNQKEQLHASLALLPDADRAHYLRKRLLVARGDALGPDEVKVVGMFLAKHNPDVLQSLWRDFTEKRFKDQTLLRLAGALADHLRHNEDWSLTSSEVIAQLMKEVDPVIVAKWGQVLEPIKAKLRKPLIDILANPNRRENEGLLATNLLVDYFKEADPGLLVQLALGAKPSEYAIVFSRLNKEFALDLLDNAVEKEKLAKRRATATVTLFLMGHPQKLWRLLRDDPQHRDDPTFQSYLIHQLPVLSASVSNVVDINDVIQQIIKRTAAPDETLLRPLILTLGGFLDQEQLSADEQAKVRENITGGMKEKLKKLYSSDNAGMRAASEWLLRQPNFEKFLTGTDSIWKEQTSNDSRDQRIAGIIKRIVQQGEEGPQWFVNSQAQTMVVLPGPVKVKMGSPPTETGGRVEERQHYRWIDRSFAIAAKPVTVAEYLRSKRCEVNKDSFTKHDRRCPKNQVNWYDAAGYCNWLSQQDGIPPSQWCYLQKDNKVISIKKDYLHLMGYRLPTEAEWEYACRAHTLTGRFYGESEELLDDYAWYLHNSEDRAHPVGLKKPNRFGLFDMHHVWNWCNEESHPYPEVGMEICDQMCDIEGIDREKGRVFRGGSFDALPRSIRSAHRKANAPLTTHDDGGFRPVRTIVVHTPGSSPSGGKKINGRCYRGLWQKNPSF
jgi:serine/threonine protein kinase/formylglycine-generating enzyme required for sulfatase activity